MPDENSQILAPSPFNSQRFVDLIRLIVTRRAQSPDLDELSAGYAGLLRTHKLEGLLGSYVQYSADPGLARYQLPGHIQKKYLTTSRFNLIQLDEIESIFGQEKDLEAVLIGGLGLLDTVYGGDYGARGVSDFDLVVSENHTDRLLAILTAKGYRPREFQEAFSPAFPGHMEWVRKEGPNLYNADIKGKIETPISLIYEFLKKHPAALLSRAKTTAGGIRIPDPTHMAILAIMGLEHKTYAKLRGYVDLALLTQPAAKAEIDWPQLVEVMHQMQAPRPAAAVLGYCRDNLGAVVPPDVLSALYTKRSPWANAWFRFFVSTDTIIEGPTRVRRNKAGTPKYQTMIIHLVRRITTYDNFGYITRILSTILFGFDTYNDILYKQKTPIGRALCRYMVHPFLGIVISMIGMMYTFIVGCKMAIKDRPEKPIRN